MTNKYVISDIHGCYNTFNELLNKIGLSKSDELFLLGDYINRGKDSKKVVDYIIDLQNQGYNITALKGNHEEMVFDSLELEDWTSGAKETLESFGINHLNQLDAKYLKWFSKLKPIHQDDEFIFVHAGLNFDVSNPFDDKRSACWIQNWYGSIDYDWLGNWKIIHGHVPIEKSQIEKMMEGFNKTKVLNIDNGCYMTDKKGYGSMVCVDLTNLKLTFQANVG
ncbi:metallophosphoesterase family protein [Carboxylicivirga sp. RSCT41]|uniref:metallophosphoesterase family protein n=1 Tax=Carboxylicivirga agarovorans TaxID=3417570 RepID=UPI003D3389AF